MVTDFVLVIILVLISLFSSIYDAILQNGARKNGALLKMAEKNINTSRNNLVFKATLCFIQAKTYTSLV